jgi:pimeloyl-ACP methyl ester carboxylesterase
MSGRCELAADIAGAGEPTFVLVHGFCSGKEDWAPQRDALSPTAKVIVPDLRGHGASPRGEAEMTIERLAADCLALCEKEKAGDLVVAGHSMGTRIALEMRNQAPGRVKGVILCDGSDAALGDRTAALANFDGAVADGKFSQWARGLFEDMTFDERFAEIGSSRVARALEVPEDTARPLYRNMVIWDAEKAEASMRACECPVLIVQSTTRGANRKRSPLAAGEKGHYAEQTAGRIPYATVATIAGHGHFIMVEAPEWTNAAILDWARANGFA